MHRSSPLAHRLAGPVVVLANLLPLVGVAAWGWPLATLLTLYWVEAMTTALVAAAKTLFAERASTAVSTRMQPLAELRAKRGGLRLRSGWPPVYVRNVPFALGVLSVSFTILVVYGGWLALSLDVQPLAALTRGAWLSVVGLAVSRLVEFRTEYLAGGEYADVSARMLAATPARHLLGLIVLAPLAAAGGPGAGGVFLLVAIVVAKTVADGYGFAVEHTRLSPGRVGQWILGPRDTSEPLPAVDAPDAAPDGWVRTDTGAVLLSGVTPVLAGLASRVGYVAVLTFVFGLLVLGPVVVAVAGGVLALVVGAKLASHYLLYGTVEYQRCGQSVVAYDTLLDEPQWVAAVNFGVDASIRNRVSDRVLGTATVRLDGVDTEQGDRVQLGPVADVNEAVDVLELPRFDTDRPAADRTVVGVAFALAVVFLAVPVGLFAAPGVDEGTAIAVTVMLGPFFALVVGLLLLSGLKRI
jgi:hypothetical protein